MGKKYEVEIRWSEIVKMLTERYPGKAYADSRVTSLYYAQSTPDTLRVIRNKAA